MKILSFGHIPTWVGGRQSSGLANVIYQLARNMSNCKDVKMCLAATDVAIPKKSVEKLTIYGWTNKLILLYILKRPIFAVKWFFCLLLKKRKFGPGIDLVTSFVKGLHLSRIVEIENPDVVHLHGISACIYESIVPQFIKIIVTFHGAIGDDINIPFYQYYYKMEKEICKSNRYSLIIFISNKLIYDFSCLYGDIKTRCITILNAYDSSSFHYIQPKEHNEITLCTIASLSERKGQKRVMDGMAVSGLHYKYLCIGAASEEITNAYKKYANDNEINYVFYGPQIPSQIRNILAEVDYMILPSSTEGFGLVYLEAIACGVPVVLPKNLPIVQEKGIIQDGVNAILLEDCSAESIAKILPLLKELHFDRKKVSESVVNYTWRNIAQQYVDSIREIL